MQGGNGKSLGIGETGVVRACIPARHGERRVAVKELHVVELEQLEELVAALRIDLSADQMERLNQASD